jgi:hypothetical protein
MKPLRALSTALFANVLSFGLLITLPLQAAPSEKKPNIILIFTDDHGSTSPNTLPMSRLPRRKNTSTASREKYPNAAATPSP